MINNHKNQGEWKIQLTIRITFISSLDTGEFRIANSKIIIMNYANTNYDRY